MAKKSLKGSGRPISRIEMNLELSPEQGKELLKTLQHRFEKNENRHKGIEWRKVKTKLQAHPKKLASLYAMESTGGEPDVVGYEKRRTNTFSMIVPRKVLKVAEVFVTTEKDRNKEKSKVFTRRATRLTSQPLWVSIFWVKPSIESYRNLENLIRKRRAGSKHQLI